MRRRRSIVTLFVFTSLVMFFPAAPAGAELPQVWCETRGYPELWCVGFDGINVTAGVGWAYGSVGYPGEMVVELVWYDWEQNHLRVNGLPAKAQSSPTVKDDARFRVGNG